MHDTTYLSPLAGASGVVIAALIIWLGPRLAAYRLADSPEYPPLLVLLPVAGVLSARWRPLWSVAFQLGTGAIFAALALRFGWSDKLWLASAYTAILLAIAYVDIDCRLVLNRLSAPGLILALAGSPAWSGIGPGSAALGALTGLVIFGALQIIGRGALGSGDTKLAVVIGAMRGLPGVFNALFCGVVLGGIGALFYLTVLRRGRKESIAYGPYLSLGCILSFFLVSP